VQVDLDQVSQARVLDFVVHPLLRTRVRQRPTALALALILRIELAAPLLARVGQFRVLAATRLGAPLRDLEILR